VRVGVTVLKASDVGVGQLAPLHGVAVGAGVLVGTGVLVGVAVDAEAPI
jgi:carbonic anhydrase/acetyltransferase-like protein (isoleucine patch superfamily)